MLSDQERARVAEKAPVWAQDIIYRLDRQLEERDQQLAKLSAGPEDSNVQIRDHVYPDRLLGVNEAVDFLIEGGFIRVEHDRSDPDALSVMFVTSGGRRRLAVAPNTANTFKLMLVGR